MAEIVNGVIDFWFEATAELYMLLNGELAAEEAGNGMALVVIGVVLVGWWVFQAMFLRRPAPAPAPQDTGAVNVTVESNEAMGIVTVLLLMALLMTLIIVIGYAIAPDF